MEHKQQDLIDYIEKERRRNTRIGCEGNQIRQNNTIGGIVDGIPVCYFTSHTIHTGILENIPK